MIKKISEPLMTIGVALTLLILIIIYADANIFHYTAYMESDIASETLLAKEMYLNGHVQPETWIVSTGKRIIAPPLLASFLYPFVGYDLNVAMGVACTVLMILLAASMLFFGRKLGLSFLETMVMILLSFVLSSPGNETQRMLFLYASYYVGHFISMFLVLGFYADALKNNRLSRWALIIIPLALVNGMQGMHANMFFYVPLLGVEILRRFVLFIRKRSCDNNYVTVWVAAIAIISLLSTKFFGSYIASETSRNIRHAPEKFFNIVLPFFSEVLGYGRLSALVVIFVLLAFAGFLFAIIKHSDNQEYWSTLTIPMGVLVVILSTTFTTAEAAPRYYLMQVFAVGVGVAMLIHFFKPDYSVYLAVLVIVYGISSGVVFYNDLVAGDHSGDSVYVKMADWMVENGYEYGYSTFDHANNMTVRSNEEVKIRPINSFSEVEGAKWLSNSKWYPPVKDAAGPTCYVVSDYGVEEFEGFVEENKPTVLSMERFDGFCVYVLDHDYTVWVE